MQSILLTGTPLERGQQFGEAFREVMRERARALPTPQPPGWAPHRHGEVSARNLYYTLDHAPELVEELRGIGQGAGIGFEAAFHLTSAVALSFSRVAPDSCTTDFAALTTDGGPMLGKTEDQGPEGAEAAADYVVQKVKPAVGYRYLAATQKHNLWTSTGMNEHGLAVGQSSGPRREGEQDGSGIHYLLIMRLILERCRTAEEGVRLLGSLKMAGKGFLFMLVDAGGGIRAVEKWYDRQAARTAANGALFFANAFQTPELQDFPPRGDRENARYRVETLARLFGGARESGGYTARFMEQTLAHHAEAGSICRHGTSSPADGRGMTGPAFLFRCRERQMGVYAGRPCQVEPVWEGFDL